MKNQELAFRKSEGNKWFLRNLKKLEENSIEISLLCNWLMPFQNDINNILEIGSGAGNKLAQLCWQLNASGQGVDPSKTAVDFANKKYNQKCSYTVATADDLSFFKNKFEIIDFDPHNSYENEYSHFKGLKSYKENYYKMFCDLGNYSVVNKFSYSEKSFCFSKNENDRISLVLLFKENK